MSLSTFGYPVSFAAIFAAIGVFVSSQMTASGTSAEESAAYEEIAAMAQGNNFTIIREKCERFMKLYPDSKRTETISIFLGESLVKSENWKEIGSFYRGLEARFPKSDNLDRFVFYQALAFFQDANFTESTPLFNRFLMDFPKSPISEQARYYLAMSYFMSNNNKEALAACREYLKRFPDGQFAGDMLYRVSFIDFNDKDVDQSEKIIRDLGAFLAKHPDDAVNGSMYCLMADTYKRMEKTDEALDSYIKAVWTKSPDDVIQYALDSATAILRERKDWEGTARLHTEFIQRKPESQLALLSVSILAKMKIREGKGSEAAEILAITLKTRIADPSIEQADLLIDELAKALIPAKKPKDIDPEVFADGLDKELVALFEKVVAGQENPTTAARICYARARLAQMLRLNDRSDLFLKEIANSNAKDPSALSPALLAACGDVLLKSCDLDGAEAMFHRLKDHFPEALCVDAGPVGLGYVALARKKPKEALDVFEQALKKPENLRFKEATLGKLEALVDLDELETAEKLALKIIRDREFRGELAAKAYLQQIEIYRKKAARAEGKIARDLLGKALGTCQRVYIAYQAFPELCAEGYMQAFETAKQLDDDELAEKTLKALIDHPKLKNTAAFKKAEKLQIAR